MARMGTADLEAVHPPGGIERWLVNIHIHLDYKPGRAYYDIGIAEVEKLITFNEYVRPVCLPYLPIDGADHLEDQFVTLAGWGYAIQARSAAVELELTSNLKLRSLRVKQRYRYLFDNDIQV